MLKGSELFEKGSGQVVVLLRETVVPCQSRDQALRIRAMFAALIFIEIIDPIIPWGTMTLAFTTKQPLMSSIDHGGGKRWDWSLCTLKHEQHVLIACA